MGYLDKAGLSRAFTKLKTLIDKKSDVGHTHTNIVTRGNVTAETGVAGRPAVSGLSMSQVYNNGYPTPYGNVISLKGTGDGQILVGWSGTDGAYAPVYVRNKRDNTTSANWSDWQQFYTTGNKPTKADVGLGNVDNTADANKSVKSATTATTATQLSTSAGSATQPVYFSGGKPVATTYTLGKSVPSNAVFTDTTYSDATVSARGLMTAADKQKLDALGGITTITKSLKLTTAWQNTGISGNNLSTGTYVVQVSGLTYDDGLNTYSEIWSGVMSWYADITNSTNAEEILLHNAGHADNSGEIYLRTIRTSGGGYLTLQIASNIAATKADNVVFKFRKLI